MGKKSIDKITKENFRQYQQLLEAREGKKKEYQSLPSNVLSCLASSKSLVRVHWSLAIVSGLGSGYIVYRGLRAWQEYKRLDKEVSKLEEQLGINQP